MTRTYLLDTNMVSYIVRGKSPAARAKLAGLARNEVGCISVITEAEIRYGLAKLPQTPARRDSVEGFLDKIRVIPWERDAAFAYGSLRAELEAEGKTLRNLDMLIAAQAIAIEAVLVTNDKAFSRVSGLHEIANWASDL